MLPLRTAEAPEALGLNVLRMTTSLNTCSTFPQTKVTGTPAPQTSMYRKRKPWPESHLIAQTTLRELEAPWQITQDQLSCFHTIFLTVAILGKIPIQLCQ